MRLSAGVPGTDITYFTGYHLFKMAKAGHFKEGLIAFTRANSPAASTKFLLTEDAQAVARFLVEKGQMANAQLLTGDSYYATSLNIPKSASKMSKSAQWGYALYKKLLVDKTFGSGVPQANIMMFQKVRDIYIKEGIPVEKAWDMAFDSVDQLFAIDETKTIGRSKLLKNIMTSFVMANRFRGSLIRSTGNIVKYILKGKEGGGVRTRVSRRFLAGIFVTYAIVEVLNKILNGHWMHENPEDQKMKLQIPITEEKSLFWDPMPAMWFVPRSLWKSAVSLSKGDFPQAGKDLSAMASIPVKVGVDLMRNKDYFGEPIWIGGDETTDKLQEETLRQKIGSGVSYFLDAFNHPYIREAWEMSLTHKDPLEGLINIFELPFKVKGVEATNWQEAYSALEYLTAELTKVMPDSRQSIIAEALSDMANDSQREKLASLLKSTYDEEDGGWLKEEFPLTQEELDEVMLNAEPVIRKKDLNWPTDTDIHADNKWAKANAFQKLGLWLEAAAAEPTSAIKMLVRVDDSVISGTVRKRTEKLRDIRYNYDRKWWHIFDPSKAGTGIVVFEREEMLYLYSDKDYGNTQVDHKISMWMGGDNQRENLDGEISTADKKKKDEMEEYLRMEWESGRMEKDEVRAAIKKWPELWETLSEDVKQNARDWHELNI